MSCLCFPFLTLGRWASIYPSSFSQEALEGPGMLIPTSLASFHPHPDSGARVLLRKTTIDFGAPLGQPFRAFSLLAGWRPESWMWSSVPCTVSPLHPARLSAGPRGLALAHSLPSWPGVLTLCLAGCQTALWSQEPLPWAPPPALLPRGVPTLHCFCATFGACQSANPKPKGSFCPPHCSLGQPASGPPRTPLFNTSQLSRSVLVPPSEASMVQRAAPKPGTFQRPRAVETTKL